MAEAGGQPAGRSHRLLRFCSGCRRGVRSSPTARCRRSGCGQLLRCGGGWSVPARVHGRRLLPPTAPRRMDQQLLQRRRRHDSTKSQLHHIGHNNRIPFLQPPPHDVIPFFLLLRCSSFASSLLHLRGNRPILFVSSGDDANLCRFNFLYNSII